MNLFKYTAVNLLIVLQVFGEECVKYDFEEDRDELFAEVRSCIDMPLWSVRFYNESDVAPPHPASKTFITPGSSRSCISSLPFVLNSDGFLEVYVYMDSKSASDEIQVLVKIFNPGGTDIAIGEASLSSENGLVITDGLQKLEIMWFGLGGSWDGYLVFLGTAAEESTILIDSYRYIPPHSTDSECILYEDVETATQETTETDKNTMQPTITSETDGNSTESTMQSTISNATDEISAESTVQSTISSATNLNSAENITEENSTEKTIGTIISIATDENTAESITRSTISSESDENSNESTIKSTTSSPTDENSGESTKISTISMETNDILTESTIESTISTAIDESSAESTIQSTTSGMTDENSAESTIRSTISSETDENSIEITMQSTISSTPDENSSESTVQSTFSDITDENLAGSTTRSKISSETDENSGESTIESTNSAITEEDLPESSIRSTMLTEIDEHSSESTIQNSVGSTIRSTVSCVTDEESGESTIESTISGITDENSAENSIRSTISTEADEDSGSTHDMSGEMPTESIIFNTTEENSEEDYYEIGSSAFTTDSNYGSSLSNPTELPVMVKPEKTFWNTVSITALSLICLIVFGLLCWCFYNCGRTKFIDVESAKVFEDYKYLQRPAIMPRVIKDGIPYSRGNRSN